MFHLQKRAQAVTFTVLSFLLLTFCLPAFAQKQKVKGYIKDAQNGEELIGANVLYAAGKGTVTDINGYFELALEDGDYTLTITFTGFDPIERKIKVQGKGLSLSFEMKEILLQEVEIVADVAISRETPVAFTNIKTTQIQEELASQDIPMVLNSTPGVYATQQGGGDGDARISIRGFSQRNVAVMIDGLPVNDMENGWVYWSNWFGLDAVTQTIQVQRGLGASKLAIPSVGGTMNILTTGIDSKKGGKIKQEVGNNGFLRTSIGLTSGKLANGWGITAAGSYKQGDGWVDKTFTDGWFYYGKIQKKITNHLFSFSVFGAPQKHGQRSYKQPISLYSHEEADKLGALKYTLNGKDTVPIPERGLQYNEHWGYLDRSTVNANGDTIREGKKIVNEKINYYHKPQLTLSDFWTVTPKLFFSNILYLSVGSGGGTSLSTSGYGLDENGNMDLQSIYDKNAYSSFLTDKDGLQRSSKVLRSSINNHFWYGFLSTFDFKQTDKITWSGGIDLRSYTGEHYREVYDLLGGNYFVDAGSSQNKNEEKDKKLSVGDRTGYYNDGLVRWGGIFGQMEYKTGAVSYFLNLSSAYSGYKRIDYFRKMELKLADTLIRDAVGFEDTLVYNGVSYTKDSPEAQLSQSDWIYIPGFTVKGGLNYNLNEHHNLFFNTGYLSKAPPFRNVIDFDNKEFRDIKNEEIMAFEVGYSAKYSKVAINVNTYITDWKNKPHRGYSYKVDDETYTVNINGMGALHKGIETDFAYNITNKLTLEGLMSLGDWKWNSAQLVRIYDDNQKLIDSLDFDAKGVHVGDAAQTQYGASIRYEIIKGLYIKSKYTYFDRLFAEFDPFSLSGANAGKDSWKVPSYALLDLHLGFSKKIKKLKYSVKFNVLNVLNEVYISDAFNNDPFTQSYNEFDAKSAAVFFGMGTRYVTSFGINF